MRASLIGHPLRDGDFGAVLLLVESECVHKEPVRTVLEFKTLAYVPPQNATHRSRRRRSTRRCSNRSSRAPARRRSTLGRPCSNHCFGPIWSVPIREFVAARPRVPSNGFCHSLPFEQFPSDVKLPVQVRLGIALLGCCPRTFKSSGSSPVDLQRLRP
jgi:hypothetical protein